MQELITINPQEFGLEKNEADQVSKVFTPMILKMQEMESEYNEVIKLQPTPENCKKAKELRLRFVKIKTGTADIHKTAKSYYLNGGRFVDGFKNAVTFAIQGKEQELSKLENHFENLEKERIAKLQEDRLKLISAYVEDYLHLQLGTMADDVWNAYYEAKKKEYEDKIEAIKIAEQERIEKEKKDKEEQEKIRKENEILKLQAEAREKELQAEREKTRLEAEAREKLERDNKQRELDNQRKILEEKEKELQKEKENERLERESAYKIFIKDNEGMFDKIIKEEGKVVLYKKIAEFII